MAQSAVETRYRITVHQASVKIPRPNNDPGRADTYPRSRGTTFSSKDQKDSTGGATQIMIPAAHATNPSDSLYKYGWDIIIKETGRNINPIQNDLLNRVLNVMKTAERNATYMKQRGTARYYTPFAVPFREEEFDLTQLSQVQLRNSVVRKQMNPISWSEFEVTEYTKYSTLVKLYLGTTDIDKRENIWAKIEVLLGQRVGQDDIRRANRLWEVPKTNVFPKKRRYGATNNYITPFTQRTKSKITSRQKTDDEKIIQNGTAVPHGRAQIGSWRYKSRENRDWCARHLLEASKAKDLQHLHRLWIKLKTASNGNLLPTIYKRATLRQFLYYVEAVSGHKLEEIMPWHPDNRASYCSISV